MGVENYNKDFGLVNLFKKKKRNNKKATEVYVDLVIENSTTHTLDNIAVDDLIMINYSQNNIYEFCNSKKKQKKNQNIHRLNRTSLNVL